MEWKEVYIKDICTVLGDGLHGTPEYDEKGDFYFINGNNLQEGHITIKKDTKRVSQKEFLKYQKELNDRTILVSINGTIGNVAKYNNEPCILGKSACFFNVKEGIDRNFIYYVISSPHFKKSIIQQATGTTIKNVSLKQMRDYHFLIPVNLSDQRKIAGILSALDSKIENNNKINANLEAQAEALFKSWFVDFTPFKDQPFVDSELGPIPQGWKVGKLGDIALQSTEKVLTRNDVKVLSPITTGKLVLSEEYFTKQVFSKSIRNYKIVKQGAFAYNPARVNIGSLGMNEFKFDGCVSPVYVVFECLKGYSFFFDLFRKTEFFKQAVISFAIGGVRQTLNYSDFALIDATIPPLNIVQSFNEIYLHLKKKISINEEENQRLAALRDTLLPKLMSGEIKL